MPIPLFSKRSAWNQRADAAAVLPESRIQMQALHRAMRAILGDWSGMTLNIDDYAIPIFCTDSRKRARVVLCDYEGQETWYNEKWTGTAAAGLGETLDVPQPLGRVRPAGPTGTESDGHLVLYDPGTRVSYEFWQATTRRGGRCRSAGGGYSGQRISEAGAVDFFDVTGSGTNAPLPLSSARATGVSLLAGLLLPEDVATGEIRHALAVAIPKPRNTAPDPEEPRRRDIIYPAAWPETDSYSTNPRALAPGQRIRLSATLRDDEGEIIDETRLAPITRIFLRALRRYGAYVVDHADGFVFYAEDIQTGSLPVSKAEVRRLIGATAQTNSGASKDNWAQVVRVLASELDAIPVTIGEASMTWSNFVVVEPAERRP
ncbi:MAG: hypothetical protein ACE5FS_11565 [Paracoccaceae bacterium]